MDRTIGEDRDQTVSFMAWAYEISVALEVPENFSTNESRLLKNFETQDETTK